MEMAAIRFRHSPSRMFSIAPMQRDVKMPPDEFHHRYGVGVAIAAALALGGVLGGIRGKPERNTMCRGCHSIGSRGLSLRRQCQALGADSDHPCVKHRLYRRVGCQRGFAGDRN
jgi:hypothetical protein